MHSEVSLLANLSISLVLALILGLIAQRLRLSPIVGYLLAGVALGPQTPGFVADAKMATELAEIGVVLLMFGVGLHFHFKDLLAVKWIALPGSIAQFLVATSIVLTVCLLSGMGYSAGLILGVSVSIASTVVVIRVLMENNALHLPAGHIAVGWLIAQDVFTVLVLVAMPALGSLSGGVEANETSLAVTLGMASLRVLMLVLVVGVGGNRVIPWLLRIVADTRSRELFTLSILAIALAVAVGSSLIFGVSMALGAFLAGMVVGQTEVSHRAAADALPMRDAFAVLFFVSVGMLFDPSVLLEQPLLLGVLLLVILVVNPLTAFTVSWFLRTSVGTSLMVAGLLSQIGEFSFLLATQAVDAKLLPPEGHSLLVACAIITIALNPFMVRGIRALEVRWKRNKLLWNRLSQRSEAIGRELNQANAMGLAAEATHGTQGEGVTPVRAVIIGYGPVGQTASRILAEFGIQPVIVDMNLETVRELSDQSRPAIYGDATHQDILIAAGIRQAKYLLITIPEVLVRSLVIMVAKELNPDVRVFARARYINEKAWLEEVGATGIVTEEGETAVSLAVLLLEEIGADKHRIRVETRKIQQQLQIRPPRDPLEG
jgi:monovalent cation:H+ antiporter-2, CPA2 family